MKIAKIRQPSPNKAKKRLFFGLLLFFIIISLPIYFLLNTLYAQLENEAWRQQRSQAEQLVDQLETELVKTIQPEQARPIAEYRFFNVLENRLLQSTSINFSPLSKMPPQSTVPGLIGYFQIDPDGSFHIPALPEISPEQQSALPTELSPAALKERIALKHRLRGLLMPDPPQAAQTAELSSPSADQAVVTPQPPASARQQSGFQIFEAESDLAMADESNAFREKKRTVKNKAQKLSEAKLKKLNIETTQWQKQQAAPLPVKLRSISMYNRQARKETVKIPDQSIAENLFYRNRSAKDSVSAKPSRTKPAIAAKTEMLSDDEAAAEEKSINILSFESEVGPLQLLRLRDNVLCFYRNAWHGKSRYIQGFIVDDSFLNKIVKIQLERPLSLPLSSLLISENGALLPSFKLTDKQVEHLIFRRHLNPPFQQWEILINSASVKPVSGKAVLDIVGLALIIIIGGGFILFYRLGASQIELAKQQRNFISSVSHELKTPLTSIRMYSEMLRADWVGDAQRKQGYYDYINFESERLSRLISNVLQLAKMDNHQENMELTEINAHQLLDKIAAKVDVQIEAAHFQLALQSPDSEPQDAVVKVDLDAFFQIMINLVDNAIKFSKQAETRRIEIGYRIISRGRQTQFFVRDYGPGVENKQMKRIFKLFYRAGDELTRTQPGTGIGLALVVQLADAMNAQVDLINRKPGAEFQIQLRSA